MTSDFDRRVEAERASRDAAERERLAELGRVQDAREAARAREVRIRENRLKELRPHVEAFLAAAREANLVAPQTMREPGRVRTILGVALGTAPGVVKGCWRFEAGSTRYMRAAGPGPYDPATPDHRPYGVRVDVDGTYDTYGDGLGDLQFVEKIISAMVKYVVDHDVG